MHYILSLQFLMLSKFHLTFSKLYFIISGIYLNYNCSIPKIYSWKRFYTFSDWSYVFQKRLNEMLSSQY